MYGIPLLTCSIGVDLDLSYVTDRVLAMGFPSAGLEALYRNPLSAVRRFLEARHAGRFRVWNLCIERGREYAPALLGLRREADVARFCWHDHSPPPLALMRPLVRSLAAFLAEDARNVAVVHCKAGKGRTGMVVSALLVRLGIAPTAPSALGMFGDERMDAATASVNGSLRFHGLTPTSLQLEGLDRHQRLLDSYQKLHAARTRVAKRLTAHA
jgi:phosphatidylinositol-3,4,5-trisphosphate 3-phosphatase/dual-specificity protein phosphatase PTEN